jgi:hypothetical protein
MTSDQKLQLLKKLLDKSEEVKIQNSSDPTFKAWKNLTERTLSRIFGEGSRELSQLSSLKFFYNPSMWVMGTDFSAEHRECFIRDWDIAIKTIKLLIEEIEEFKEEEEDQETDNGKLDRIFISHSSDDKELIEDLIDILESIGVTPNQIFCSSFDGYGIPLGKDFLKTLKDEISKKVLVLFVLSKNFYGSPICLCEMGASWVLSKDHIPIIVPPFSYDDIEGVIPLTQGLPINDELKMNLLRERVIELLNVSEQPMSAWERKRDRAISRINQKIGLS